MIDSSEFTRRGVLGMAAAGVGGLLLGACGGNSSPASGGLKAAPVAKNVKADLTLYNWGTPVDKKIWDDAIARFNKNFPNVNVTNNIVPVTSWADYADKLATLVAGGKSPDLINIGGEGYRLGVAKNLVLPLDAAMAKVPEIAASMNPRLIEGASVDGKVYWLPHLYETMVIFYNTKMFNEAGIPRPADDWSWDDFLGVAQTLTSGSGSEQNLRVRACLRELPATSMVAHKRVVPVERRLQEIEPHRSKVCGVRDLHSRPGP